MYRRYANADGDRLAQLMHLAFGTSTDEVRKWWARFGTEHIRVWQDRQVVGGLIDIPMGQFIGGRRVPMHGVAGVVVDPTTRGRGVARRMMTAYLQELADAGIPLSTLYASTRSLYRAVGYEVAGTCYEASVPTAALRGQGVVSPHWRPGTDEDWPRIEAACSSWTAPRTGWPDRGPYLWQRIRDHRGVPNDVFVHEGPAGLDAWVVLRQSSALDSVFMDVTVVDFGARDADALRAVVGFVGGFSSMARTLRLVVGPSEPLLDFLPEHLATVKLYEPWMLRLVDVVGAMAGRGWPSGLNLSVDLDVVDDVLPQNHGRFRLAIEDGSGALTEGGNGTIGVTIHALAALYTGYASPWELRQRGVLQGPADALSPLAAAFAGPAPHMVDQF